MSNEGNQEGGKKLSELFTGVWEDYNNVESCKSFESSDEFQGLVKRALLSTEHLQKLVEQLDLYSENEEFDEIATKDIKFLLLPALMGKLHLKVTSRQREQRPAILKNAVEHLSKFLTVCVDYGLVKRGSVKHVLTSSKNDDVTKPKLDAPSSKPDLNAMAEERAEKIRKLNEKKQRKEEIAKLAKIDADDSTQVDDAQLRRLWRLRVDDSINEVVEDLESIKLEKEMLEMMKNMPVSKPPPRAQPPAGFKPFMLTKNKLQKEVFGHGYPSLPTMTVDEWYEKEAAQGRMPDSGNMPVNQPPTDAHEEVSDEDDDEKVMKDRAFDEWKDTHRRGDGNRYNKG